MKKKTIIRPEENKFGVFENFLNEDKKKLGNVFLPTTEFYAQWDDTRNGLVLMFSRLVEFLDIKISKNFIVDFYDIEPPGLYFKKGKQLGIVVNEKHKNNPVECAAILSHELIHYYLEGIHNVTMEDQLENEKLTDIGTIYAGFGVLIINSFEYSSGWETTLIGMFMGGIVRNTEARSFGYFKPEEYCLYFKKYLDYYKINYGNVYGYILPKPKHFLPIDLRIKGRSGEKEKTEYTEYRRKSFLKQNVLKIIYVIVAFFAIGAILSVLDWILSLFGYTISG